MIPPSVNFHFWQPCNMTCRYCFARFHEVKKNGLPKGHLPKEKSIQIIKLLAHHGAQKITFVGGEPTLCPWLGELLMTAKNCGLTTCVVTNGSKVSPEWLNQHHAHLDWIGFSIDSVDESTNIEIGRSINGRTITAQHFKIIAKAAHFLNIGIKVNTVVSMLNRHQDLSPIINSIQPNRWKIFQAMTVEDQNGKYMEGLSVSSEIYDAFITRHKDLSPIAEPEDLMRGSYLMIDPSGCFYDTTDGSTTKSRPILEVGIVDALSDIQYSHQLFTQRGGLYNWEAGNQSKPS